MATLRARTDEMQARLMQAARNWRRRQPTRPACSSISRRRSASPPAPTTRNRAGIVREACDGSRYRSFPKADGPFRWSEDFGLFGAPRPSAFFVLGAGEDHPQLHNPDYDFPDEIIPQALAIFETIARAECG
jgi:metal-dependent amidase/aminoacylase/carboxypeptidase family protein